MVKTIKIICIAGIFALLVLFVVFTGNSKGENNDTGFRKSLTEQTNKTPKPDKSNKKIDASSSTNFIKNIVP
ncbi:MAG: hypothetical protein U0W24_19085 [Bacteroidales bacterium]